MSISGVNGALTGAYPYMDKTEKTVADKTGFTKQLQKAGAAAEATKADAYREYLKQKYGNVSVQNVGKDQRSIDRIGAGTAGTGNVVIAQNILEQMANDPKKAAYYEEKIQHYFNSLPKCQAELSAMGHEIHSSGIVIHPDGTVTHYISGDLKPEERAKIEARVKAESEAKAKRRRQYQELGEEAAKKRRLETETAYKRHSMTELQMKQAVKAGRTAYMGTSETMSSVLAAYKWNAMTISEALR